jgi:cysteinyl-tRNA synthetase
MDAIKSAEETVKGVENFVAEMQTVKGGKDNSKIQKVIEKARKDFENALDDDLNTPLGLKALFDMMKEVNRLAPISEKDARLVLEAIFDADKVLGLELSGAGKVWHSVGEAEKEVKELILKREDFRSEKKWKEADSIRDALRKKGIIVEDTAQGPRWKKI